MIYTYLAKAGQYYKIGQSKNPEQRMKTLKTGSPDIRLICYGTGETEKRLHVLYKHKRQSGEWFKLSCDDVEDIIKRIKNEFKTEYITTKSQQKKLDFVIKFGKYEGRKISTLTSDNDLKYLEWCLNNVPRLSKYTRNMFKWWLNQMGYKYKIKDKRKNKNKKTKIK